MDCWLLRAAPARQRCARMGCQVNPALELAAPRGAPCCGAPIAVGLTLGEVERLDTGHTVRAAFACPCGALLRLALRGAPVSGAGAPLSWDWAREAPPAPAHVPGEVGAPLLNVEARARAARPGTLDHCQAHGPGGIRGARCSCASRGAVSARYVSPAEVAAARVRVDAIRASGDAATAHVLSGPAPRTPFARAARAAVARSAGIGARALASASTGANEAPSTLVGVEREALRAYRAPLLAASAVAASRLHTYSPGDGATSLSRSAGPLGDWTTGADGNPCAVSPRDARAARIAAERARLRDARARAVATIADACSFAGRDPDAGERAYLSALDSAGERVGRADRIAVGSPSARGRARAHLRADAFQDAHAARLDAMAIAPTGDGIPRVLRAFAGDYAGAASNRARRQILRAVTRYARVVGADCAAFRAAVSVCGQSR